MPCFGPKRGLFVNRTTVLTHLRLRDAGTDVTSVISQLRTRLAQSPGFLARDQAGSLNVVLDLDSFPPQAPEALPQLVAALREMHIEVMGIANASQSWIQAANRCGMPLLRGGQQTRSMAASSLPKDPTLDIRDTTSTYSVEDVRKQMAHSPSSGQVSFPKTVVLENSLRSGQQVYAKDASLVILGSINSGAECVADGDVIVFGQLSGRVLAGASGNTSAKIFTTSFHAELVSIASIYKAGADLSAVEDEKPAVVWLENGQLQYCNFALK